MEFKTVGAYKKVMISDEDSAAKCYKSLTAALDKFQSDIGRENGN